MKNFSPWLLVLLWTASLPVACFAEGEEEVVEEEASPPKSPQALNLLAALSDLRKNPGESKLQEHFLNLFPKDIKSYEDLFDRDDDGELSAVYGEYLKTLVTLWEYREHEVGRLVVDLAKQASGNKEAIGNLRGLTVDFGNHHPEEFSRLLKHLSKEDRGHLIAFLADVEDHVTYPEYEDLILALQNLDENKLAEEFRRAKEKRMEEGTNHVPPARSQQVGSE